MKKLILAVLAVMVAGLLVLPACGDSVPSDAVAKVGDGVVTKAEFDKYMDQARGQANQSGAPPFPSEGTPAYNQYAAQLVDYLVTQQIMIQQAEKLDISVSDDEVNKRVDELYKAYGGQKKVEEILKQQNMTLDQLKDLLKTQIITEKVRAEVTKNAQPTDEKLKEYYDQNKAQFDKTEQRTTRHILVKDKATADMLYQKLKANPSDANWKKLAKQYTIDPSGKSNGGELGPVTKGQMVAPFEKAVFAAKKGEVMPPVKSQFGWHVLQVTDIIPAKVSTFEEVKAQISQMLASQLVEQAYQDWLKKAKDDAGIKYAAGFDPAKLTASPSAAPVQQSPQPQATK
jgi:foldase protein PrsA